MRQSTRFATITAAVLLAACEHSPSPVGLGSPSIPIEEQRAMPGWSAWSPPVNLGPVVNSSANDQHPAISRDGLSLYFASDRAGGSGGLDLYVTRRNGLDAPWGAPVNLGPVINSPTMDLAPDLTDDGHHLFYHSGRPGGCGDLDLYETSRDNPHDDLGWGPPVNLGCVVNGPFKDAGPAYTLHDGDEVPTMYFTSTRPGGFGDFDIYKSKLQADGSWGPAVHVPELSGPFRDTRITIAPSGLELFISSDVTGRPNGVGGQDLWRSTREHTFDAWSAPVNLGPGVNTTGFDGAPSLSFDGTTLYFFSDRPGGFGANDLYVTTRTRIQPVTPASAR